MVAMSMKLETVTPEKAMSFLKRNVNNRPISRPLVVQLREAILADEWQVNGESIKLNGSGDMIDGQHRCTAIFEASKAIKTYVARGLEHKAFDTLDQGRKRSISDVFARRHEKNYAALAGAVKAVAGFIDSGGKYLIYRSALRPQIATQVLSDHPAIRDSVAFMTHVRIRDVWSITYGSALHYLFSTVDKAKADDLFEKIGTGENLTKTMPAFLVRQKMIAAKTSREPPTREAMFGAVIKAWNVHLKGGRAQRISLHDANTLPVIRGLDYEQIVGGNYGQEDD